MSPPGLGKFTSLGMLHMTSARLRYLGTSLRYEGDQTHRVRDASLAHLTPDEIAMHPRGHALLEAP